MRFAGRAYAKINWALNIVGRRGDGYHLLDMLMQSIALGDDMAFEDAAALTLTVNGRPDPEPERNLVMRAARALQGYTGTRRGAAIALQKNVPARAGLGGGSADCALTLRALDRLWELHLSEEELLRLGAGLGADVPFCLTGGLARVRGIGERLDPIPAGDPIPLTLVTPGGGLSTAEVFDLFDRGGYAPVSLDAQALADAVTRRDLPAIDALAVNALTAPAVALMPEIAETMARLRAAGARAVLMTGSGSTVVGAFDAMEQAQQAAQTLPGAIVTATRGETDTLN